MSLIYTRASRIPSGGGGTSVVMAPVIDRTGTETSLLLRCDHPATVSVGVSGNPFPVVTWFVGSRRIEESPEWRFSVDPGGGKQVLSISRVTKDLEDGIRVEAANCAGSDRIRIDVKTYQFFTGNSPSELTRSATLPVGHRPPFLSEESDEREVKTIHYKSYNRFQMTKEDYEQWEKEMESRSHMRSIDDIIDNLSDDNDSDEVPDKENLPTSCDDNFPTTNKPPPPPAPPGLTDPLAPIGLGPPSPTDAPNLQEVKGPEATPSSELASSSQHDHVTIATKPDHGGYIATKPNSYCGSSVSMQGDGSVWEIFGSKLSDFCRKILSSDKETSSLCDTDSQTDPGPVPRPASSGIRSLPSERNFLGSKPPKPRLKPLTHPEVARTTISGQRPEQEGVRPVDPGSPGSDSHGRQSSETVSEKKRSPTVRPPLAPKPSFSGIKSKSPAACHSSSSTSIPRSLSGDPHDIGKPNTLPNDLEKEKITDRADRISVKDLGSVNEGPHQLDSTTNPDSTNEMKLPDDPADKSSSMTVPDPHRHHTDSTTRKLQTTKFEETHFGDPPEASAPSCHPPPGTENTRPVDEVFADSANTPSTERLPSKIPNESPRKKPPVAKNKPFWCPSAISKTVGIRPNSATCSSGRQVVYPDNASQSPTTPVRRVRSQSSGKVEESVEGIPDSPGPVEASISAGQLSYCPEKDDLHESPTVSRPSATKSEGLLTVRKLTALPSAPDAATQKEGRGWRPTMPVSRSFDVLDSRDVESAPRIGRRSVSKEWKLVTVTTKEEIVIIRRPSSGTVTSSRKTDDTVTWKLPLGTSRPFAV